MFGCAEGRIFADCVASRCSADIGGLLRGVGPFGVCVPSISSAVITRFCDADGVGGIPDGELLGV